MVILDHVSTGYKNCRVFTDLSYEFQGGICAVLGRSGSGKSTLFKAIAGILPMEGRILLDGTPVSGLRVAPVPQKNSLIPWMTAEKNITFPAKERGIYAPAHAEVVFHELGIGGLLSRYPNHLSGGEAQRVCLARALLFLPELLLMDESFSALDAASLEEAHKCFLRVQKAHAVPTLVVTHSIDEAFLLADSITVLSGGKLQLAARRPYGPDDRERLVSLL